MILSHGTEGNYEHKEKMGNPETQIGHFLAGKGEAMHQRLICEVAFDMTRVLVSMIGHDGSDEEYRWQFEQVFQTCRASLETYCRQVQRMEHQLRPLEKDHVPATAR